MSPTVQVGNTISVNYTGKLESGEVFDTSEGKQPLTFTVGSGQLIKGFDNAVIGMSTGEKKSVSLAPEEGYGAYRDDLILSIARENVPENMQLDIGMAVQLSDQSGNPIPAMVTEIGDRTVTLDVNHPLAGKVLVFDIEVVGIES
jgi:peptidylprolyl isomerase